MEKDIAKQEDVVPVAGGKIHQAIVQVMKRVTAISKARQSTQYKYRGIDDVYNSLHSILAEEGVFTVPTVLDRSTSTRQTKGGGTLFHTEALIRYRFFTTDGSYVDAVVVGEGMDSGDKATNKAMAIAHKYALTQTFAIPTEDAKDPDGEVHEVKHPTPKPAVAKIVPAAAAMGMARDGIAASSTGNADWQIKPATTKQIGMLKGQWQELERTGLAETAWQELLNQSFGKSSAKELTGREASQLIDFLGKKLKSGENRVS